MSCDLHIHSTCSDGAVPIERLASIAARTGLHAIALSDHDTLLSAQYAYAHTGQDGVELIPAVELTGYDFERQHRVHLLCYYPDVDCPALREHCAVMKERRNACALQSAKELEQLYPQFTTDLAWETTKASGVLFKSGLMQALELLGLTDGSIYGETYHKLFGWNPRGIVLHSPEYLPVRQVLATAKASGGAVVFALMAAVLFVALVGFARGISVLMQAPAEALDLTASYVRICGAGIFFIVAYNVLSAIFRGLGDSKSPLLFVLVACIVNVFGDLLLVAGLHLDAAGAAIATVAAQAVSVVFAVALLIKKKLPFAITRGLSIQSSM